MSIYFEDPVSKYFEDPMSIYFEDPVSYFLRTPCPIVDYPVSIFLKFDQILIKN